ncbi:MAG: DUF3105 domain-containing protein [Nocardioides sp.]
MAKPAKSDRRAVIDQMRKKQKNADRNRNFAIVGVCVLIAALILGAAVFPILKDKWDERAYADKAVAEIGAAASSCQEIETKKADGNQDHVPVDTPVEYTTAPPAFGAHWNEAGIAPASFTRKLYTDDRPPLEALVHNLEHGYTILWYDETIADDDVAMDELAAIADKFSEEGEENFRDKFIAAPWTSDDENGETFPEGQHVAFTHWSIGGEGQEDTSKQQGVFQYCSEVSGEALDSFMKEYPYFDSPEPGAM